jgi:hypothetical protein
MAQIIKHRRGSLESVSSATKRAGELLVVTGSTGITAANGDTILLVGIDGSTVTPANKVLQGTSVPDLTGASYDTSVDGIPYYDTSAEKFYILNKGGNVEVKATANTGGSGIVSGSAQVDALGFLQVGGDGVVSGSSQITVTETTGFSTFSSSLKATDDAQDGRLNNLETFSASEESKNSTLATLTGSFTSRLNNLESTSASHDSRLDDLESFSSSLDNAFVSETELAAATGALETADSAQQARLSSLEAETGSIATAQSAQDARLSSLETETGSIASAQSAQDARLSSIEGFTSSIDTTIKTKLNVETVVSSSAQVVSLLSDQATDFGTGRVSADDFGDADGGSTFTGSFVGDGSQLTGLVTDLRISGSTGNDVVSLLTDDLSVIGTANQIETTVTDGQIQIGIVENPTLTGNVTISGNLQVQGTTTTVDSTTVNIGDNIIELNGTGAVFGGIMIGDVTAPNQVSGSLLWDATNDYWIAGASGSESKVLLAKGDSVVSGSSQITITSTTGFSTFSSSLKATDDAQDVRLTDLETFETTQGAKNTTLQTVTASYESRLGQLETDSGSQAGRLNNLEATSASHDGRLDDLETFSASLDATFEEKASGTHTLVSGSSQIVSFLDGEDVNLGGISGSTLDITGNAKIDGNLVLGGNITIGDASGDTISFGGEVSSDIIPSADNTYDLGSATDKFAEVHATTIYGAINATNGVVSGSDQVLGGTNIVSSSSDTSTVAFDITDGVISADVIGGVHSGSAQVVSSLLNQATDFGTGRVSGDNFGDADGGSTFTGSFVGDGSGLTGLATVLSISGSTGNDTVDLLSDSLLFTGSGVISATVSDGTVTFTARDASTSLKGVASFDSDDFSVTSGNVSIKSEGVRAVNLNADVAGTGISLNGVDNSIEVDYGSTSGTAVEGNTSLVIQGTANEIAVSNGSITLGAGGTVTVGLPDDVTIQTGSVVGDFQVGNDLTVVGNLYVQGTTTTVDSTTVQIGDNILELNFGGAQTTAGLLVTDATAPNTVSGSLVWDGSNDYWKGGALGSEKEFARLNSTPTSGSVQVIGVNGLLVDSTITDDGQDVSITGDFTIGGLSANSFVFANGSKTLTAVTPSNAGDLIQWNGSSFVASNEIDGGTF